MKFFIKKEELYKLSTLVKTSKVISDVSIKSTHFMFKVDNDKLYALIYGSGNIVQFFVQIDSLSKEESESSYFNVDVMQLIQAMEKVVNASESDTVLVEVALNKIVVSSGKSKISVNIFDVLGDEDFNEAFNAINEKKKNEFTKENPSYALISDEVVCFLETVGKFISMVGSDRVSGLSLQKDHILYCDQAFSIIDKKVDKDLTNGDKVYIPQSIFNLLSSIYKLSDDFNVVYSDNSDYALIDVPMLNFMSIISLPSTLCEYPEENILKSIEPDDNNCLDIKVDVKTLLKKMDMFDGIFSASQWRWKVIEFYYSSNEKTIGLRYNNMCAEVDTDLPTKNIDVCGNIEDFSFRLASIMVYDYLNKLVNQDLDADIKVSPISETEEHGIGVKFKIGDFTLVTSKVVADQEV